MGSKPPFLGPSAKPNPLLLLACGKPPVVAVAVVRPTQPLPRSADLPHSILLNGLDAWHGSTSVSSSAGNASCNAYFQIQMRTRYSSCAEGLFLGTSGLLCSTIFDFGPTLLLYVVLPPPHTPLSFSFVLLSLKTLVPATPRGGYWPSCALLVMRRPPMTEGLL